MLLLLGFKKLAIGMCKKLDYIKHITKKVNNQFYFSTYKTLVEAACSGALAKKNFAYKIA